MGLDQQHGKVSKMQNPTYFFNIDYLLMEEAHEREMNKTKLQNFVKILLCSLESQYQSQLDSHSMYNL